MGFWTQLVYELLVIKDGGCNPKIVWMVKSPTGNRLNVVNLKHALAVNMVQYVTERIEITSGFLFFFRKPCLCGFYFGSSPCQIFLYVNSIRVVPLSLCCPLTV